MLERASNLPRVLRFGVFEVDLASHELRKRGARLKLQEQPFHVLAALLEQPGELVSREDLKEGLWTHDTFVEFDHGLNTAIQKIRQALGDSAESPRYVETVPRKGYRFLANVESLDGPNQTAETAAVQPAVRWRRRGAFWWVLAAALASAAAITVLVVRRPRGAPDSPPPVLTQLTFDSGLTYQPAISRDGTLVAYASDRSGEGNLDIWVQQIGGSSPVRLTTDPADDNDPHFSPDGTRIAFRSQRDGGGIYVIPALGGDAKLLAKDGRRPLFSPDGKRIAYWVGGEHLTGDYDNAIYVVSSSGAEPKYLTAGRSPVWSPDGKRMLFVLRPETSVDPDWWVIPVDGGPPVKTEACAPIRREGLLHDLGFVGNAFIPSVWLPDGSVVFSARQRASTNIYRIWLSPKTWQPLGPPERLTFGSAKERDPSVNPSGRLVYSSLTEDRNIWVLAIDANRGEALGAPERATADAAINHSPSLSADGKRLAFGSDRSGNPDIWVKDLESGKFAALAETAVPEQRAVVKSDGSSVAYYAAEGDRRMPATYAVPWQGGPARKICEDCGTLSDWTRDGKRMSFFRLTEVRGYYGVWSLDLKSGEYLQLARAKQLLSDPRFSPDGRWVAFHMLLGGGRRQVFLAPAAGAAALEQSQWMPITNGSTNDFRAAWSPDGNLLYFVSDRDGFLCIYAQRLDPATKAALGPARDVYHAHATRRSFMRVVNLGSIGLSVARDKMAFMMAGMAGNVWLLEPAVQGQ